MDNGQEQCSKCSTSGTVFDDNMDLIIRTVYKVFTEQKEGEISNLCLPYLEILLRVGESRRLCSLTSIAFCTDFSQIIANSRYGSFDLLPVWLNHSYALSMNSFLVNRLTNGQIIDVGKQFWKLYLCPFLYTLIRLRADRVLLYFMTITNSA